MRKTNNEINTKIGHVKPKGIVEEMEEAYIDYAMSVIISRALPDVRDGLKPVHRRILYTMYKMGLRPDAKFRKSATVVGSCLGSFHPHGDIAVYDAAIRMAQDFSLRYPLIQGQGNMGSIDDPSEYAAMRYTEMRLSKIGEEMLSDIEKNTVNFVDNYDGTKKEPTVLPSPLPNLLLNGSLGIAVGMATNIPPHNLSEVVDALIFLVDHPEATTEDLFKWIKGPDFPTGGSVFNQKEMISAYSQGKGPILVRGKAEISENEKGRDQIIITEIPYQVQKSALIKQFADLVSEKKIQGIRSIRDESDKEGMRIVIDLQKKSYPQRILRMLYKYTDLQRTFHLNMLALVNGIQPKVLGLSDLLRYFIAHRKEVVLRRAKFDYDKAKERNHILVGLNKCLGKIDEVIKTIKASENREKAQQNLMKKFKLSEIQANAILDTKLSGLAKLERKKIEEELKLTENRMKELSAILKSPEKVKMVIKKELKEAKEKFGDERRTVVYSQKINEISEKDLIPLRDSIITLTQGGYIKRMDPSIYKVQKRGGKGILGMKTIKNDIIEHFITAKTHDFLLFFTDSGKVFKVPVYEIPEESRLARGRGVMNFLEISSQERILSLVPLKKELSPEFKYMVMVTQGGIIKKTALKEFGSIRRSGLKAISLRKGDSLCKVDKSGGSDEVILVTQNGQSIRFKESQVREMGRTAAGVKGISLRKDDKVTGMDIVKKKDNQYLLVVTEAGYGKRTDLRQYKLQSRGGRGIKTAKVTQKTGKIVFSKVLTTEEDLIVISKKGQVIRTKIKSIPKLNRATQGARIMRLQEGDGVASAICI